MTKRNEPWRTREGEAMDWAGMDAFHLANAARFLREAARHKTGILPGVSRYTGSECSTLREAISAAKAMERLARQKLRAAQKNRCRTFQRPLS